MLHNSVKNELAQSGCTYLDFLELGLESLTLVGLQFPSSMQELKLGFAITWHERLFVSFRSIPQVPDAGSDDLR